MELEVDRLHIGDNLFILDHYVPDESVDLVYLDPPFKKNRAYHLIFRDESGRTSDAQQLAFDDSWHWGPTAEAHYLALATPRPEADVPSRLTVLIAALVDAIGANELTAYLVEMAVRLVELRRVMKPTGSIYLHCDPTASHYLKLLMDAVFGPTRFLAEIVWKRTSAHSSAKRPAPVHDVILLYSKSAEYTWNPQYMAHDPSYLRSHYAGIDPSGRRYTLSDLTAAGVRRGSSGQSWRGFDPTMKGNHWKFTIKNLERLDAEGRLYWPAKGGWPRYRRYLDEVRGVPLQDVWTDIAPVNAKARERLGYPTQKPVALLQRIIRSSSNPGDVVLDPFAGCGTLIEACIEADEPRQWIGIDISDQARRVINDRFMKLYDKPVPIGQIAPKDVETARTLATLKASGRHDFETWAVHLIGGQPVARDRGRDGIIPFVNRRGKVERAIISVKSGRVVPAYVRELRGAVTRDRAPVGVLVTLEPSTAEMRLEATRAGMYDSKYPRLQILTIAQLLDPDGARPKLPQYRQAEMFPRAPEPEPEAEETLADQVASLMDDRVDEARRARQREVQKAWEQVRESVRQQLLEAEEQLAIADVLAGVEEEESAPSRAR